MHAFVLDRNRKPLTPCRMARARILLKQGRAAVFRVFPFTIILQDREDGPAGREHRIKIDPGSKTTGVAIVQEGTRGERPGASEDESARPSSLPPRPSQGRVVAAVEIEHRGQAIKASLASRRALRRGRRARKTRYRKPRFDNRTRREGWLPPSLESRVAHVLTWFARLCRLCPITAAAQELVRFDLQKERNPEIAGVEYQQGTLAGYEVREYLLEKYKRGVARTATRRTSRSRSSTSSRAARAAPTA